MQIVTRTKEYLENIKIRIFAFTNIFMWNDTEPILYRI